MYYTSPYGMVVPNVLPHFREVPLNYTSPASDQPHPPPTHAHPPTQPAAAQPSSQHHNRHLIDLSTLRSKVSVPSSTTDSATTTTAPNPNPAVVDATHPIPHPPPYFHLPVSWAHQFPLYHHTSPAPTSATHPLAAAQPWIPCADVRETARAYFLEIEAPGLAAEDKDSVTVTWLSSRTLLVTGTTRRAVLSLSHDEDGGELCRTASPMEGEEKDKTNEEPVLLFGERAVGEWRRQFILPADCDLGVDPSLGVSPEEGLRCTVEHGVVTVEVPKVK